MKMRNWLKTTLALGLVAATGSVMVGCGCDNGTTISYKDAMTAYHEVFTVSATGPSPTTAFTDKAKDGFTLTYELVDTQYKADGTKDKDVKTNITLKTFPTTGTGDSEVTGMSYVEKTTKNGSEDAVTEKVTYAKTKVGEATEKTWEFYNKDSKKITTDANYDVIDFAQAYEVNIFDAIFASGIENPLTDIGDFGLLNGLTELAEAGSAYKDEADIVKKWNEDNNKTASLENTKKVLTTKFVKTGDASYELTLKIEQTTWSGTADALKATVNTQEMTFKIKDKAVTKIVANSKTVADGKQTKGKKFTVTVEYKKPSLTAATSITAPETAIEAPALIGEQFKVAS